MKVKWWRCCLYTIDIIMHNNYTCIIINFPLTEVGGSTPGKFRDRRLVVEEGDHSQKEWHYKECRFTALHFENCTAKTKRLL